MLPTSVNKRAHQHTDGYPSLSAFIASDKDGTSVIYKRFNRLAARNLLLLQSELAELESRLDAFDRDDEGSIEPLQTLRNWEDYKIRNKVDSPRMLVLEKIKSTMKEYREALVAESTIAALPSPDRKTLKAFRFNFFHGRPGSEEAFPMLGGRSATLYDDPDDLIALPTAQTSDRLTLFVQDNFGFLFKDASAPGAASTSSVGYASGKKIAIFISWLSTVLAALLLVGAVVALYNTRSDNLKLGLIALFTTLFAASVGLLTNAKKAEVFGATAAYAAVLVVFVSGDLGQ